MPTRNYFSSKFGGKASLCPPEAIKSQEKTIDKIFIQIGLKGGLINELEALIRQKKIKSSYWEVDPIGLVRALNLTIVAFMLQWL